MDEFLAVLGHWKEIGGVGVGLYLLFRLFVKIVEWLLDVLDINIKRKQSREDILADDVAKMRVDLDELREDVVQLKGAYRVVHDVAHESAEGIASELSRLKLDLPTVMFYVNRLRTIQAIEQILKV